MEVTGVDETRVAELALIGPSGDEIGAEDEGVDSDAGSPKRAS